MSTRPELPIMHGTTASKVVLPCLIDDDGSLIVTGGVGGGAGATEAEVKNAIETATNLNLLEEVLGNSPLGGDYPTIQESVAINSERLFNISEDLGRTFQSPATSDTGTFSLIQLFKRFLDKVGNIDDLFQTDWSVDASLFAYIKGLLFNSEFSAGYLNTIQSRTPVLVNDKVPVYGSIFSYNSTSAANISTVLVPSTDISDFSLISLQVDGTFTATLRPQGSNNNSTWFDIPVVDAIAGATITSITAPGIYLFPKICRHVRADFSAYTTGTVFGRLFTSNIR
jgi:hypothetical protein